MFHSRTSYATAAARNNPPSLSPQPRSSPSYLTPDGGPWEVHPICGIVHSVEASCNICEAQLEHIRRAKRHHTGQDSFGNALRTLHDQNDNSYEEGFKAGIDEGIRITRLNLTSLTIQDEPTRGRLTNATDTSNSAVEAPVNRQPAPTQLVVSNQRPDLKVLSLQDSMPATPTETQWSPVSSQTSGSSHSRGTKFRGPVGYNSAFWSSSVETELRALFDAAHKGNTVALNRVRSLAREAHSTPRDSKSWGQKFVLNEWRNPNGPNPNYFHTTRATTGVANPRLDDPVEDWLRYYTVHSSFLPKGVRRDAHGNPYLPDLRASRLYAQMRPIQTASPPALRTEYGVYSMELITNDGAYASIVRRYNLQIARALDCKPYDGPSKVDIEEVARHFARCGVSVQLLNNDFVPWAREHQKGTEAL
ncbi:hypothetical protein V5O48_011963 [Marasmius crinis-equi]|uniref:Uncharacterized protein n=1 Tax=Marasmius crinis-equi TaxID=585013 RepID=A0ABR3F474_9AGAR